MWNKLFITFILSMPSIGFAAGSQCLEIFSVDYGKLNSSYIDGHYDVQVPSISPVKNQGNTPFCHLYTWSSEMESQSGIRMANGYTDARFIYERAVEKLDKGGVDLGNQLGNWAQNSRRDIANYGVVPLSAWRGNRNYNTDGTYSRLIKSLETVMRRTSLLNKSESEMAKKAENIENAKTEMLALLSNMIGPMPTTFNHRGKEYSPVEFALEHFPELTLPVVDVWISSDSKDKARTAPISRDHLNMDHEQAEVLMRKVIDSGRSVYLSYTQHDQFTDKKNGVMSISGFQYPELAKLLTHEEMNTVDRWEGSHAVLVVGYEIDPATGRVRKWKIKNSWGTKAGDHGFFHMYKDFFEAFAWEFLFVNDGTVKIE